MQRKEVVVGFLVRLDDELQGFNQAIRETEHNSWLDKKNYTPQWLQVLNDSFAHYAQTFLRLGEASNIILDFWP